MALLGPGRPHEVWPLLLMAGQGFQHSPGLLGMFLRSQPDSPPLGAHQDYRATPSEGSGRKCAGQEFRHSPRSACSCGDIKIVKLLLENAVDVNAQGNDSDTPLCSACSSGHIDIVQLLLQKGADVNAQGKHSATPLHWACIEDHIDVVALLLQMGADVNLQVEVPKDSADSFTPLHLACYRGHTTIVELLLQKDVDLQVPLRASPLTLPFTLHRAKII
jgi:hypothetical protein